MLSCSCFVLACTACGFRTWKFRTLTSCLLSRSRNAILLMVPCSCKMLLHKALFLLPRFYVMLACSRAMLLHYALSYVRRLFSWSWIMLAWSHISALIKCAWFVLTRVLACYPFLLSQYALFSRFRAICICSHSEISSFSIMSAWIFLIASALLLQHYTFVLSQNARRPGNFISCPWSRAMLNSEILIRCSCKVFSLK